MSLRRRGRRAWPPAGRDAGRLRSASAALPLLVYATVCFGFAAQACAQGSLASSTQTAATPALHKRTAGQPDPVPAPVRATGHTDLPPTAEGRYPWDSQGGEIELYFEGGRLDGYMTEHIDLNPHVAPVTFRFATTHVDAHAVAWTTQAIHGVFYSFSGHLERGPVASPSLPGYYLLTGTLTVHSGAANGSTRTVSLRREPGE